jgi:sugar diacid utilization regulator
MNCDMGDQQRCRDLVNDLVTNVDDDSVYARARQLGHDWQGRHWMVLTQYRDQPVDDALAEAVEQVASFCGLGQLTGQCSGMVLLVARRPPGSADEEGPRWGELHRDVSVRLMLSTVEMGVGGACAAPAEVPRSWHQALRALAVRQAARTPGGVRVYDELGISRFLPEGSGQREAELFVRHWLGPVLDCDGERASKLVMTLSSYLDHDGDLVATAAELSIHRSTLRHRLHLIAELTVHTPTGRDITDRGNWPILRVAAWVHQILTASRW